MINLQGNKIAFPCPADVIGSTKLYLYQRALRSQDTGNMSYVACGQRLQARSGEFDFKLLGIALACKSDGANGNPL